MTMFDNLDEKLRESFDSLEKEIYNSVDSPPECGKFISENFWDLIDTKETDTLKESKDSLEKAITEHLVDSPPEFNKTVDNHFWEMAGVEPNENNHLKELVRHFNKIYNKRYKWDCSEQYYEIGDTVYYPYGDQIMTGKIAEIEDFRSEKSPNACVFYWVNPDNIKWYEKLVDKVRYFYYSSFRRDKVYFPNRKYFGHAVGREDIYPTHKEALYNLIMNNLCDDMDKLQFIFVDGEYNEFVKSN